MKFILTRHCETDWNREGRLQGHSDTHLNEYGWFQAEELAQNLKNLGIKKIISSDLKRSVETSSVLAKYLKVPIELDARIRECAYGKLEGSTKDEALVAGYGSLQHYDFESLGGESRERVLRRHLSFLDDVHEKESDDPILLVGHGTGLNTLLFHLGKPPISRGEFVEIEYPN